MVDKDYTASFNKMITAMGESNGRLELINVDTSSLVKSVDSLYDLFKGDALAAKEKSRESKLGAGKAHVAKISGKAGGSTGGGNDMGLGDAASAIAGAGKAAAAGAGMGGFLAGIGAVAPLAMAGVGVIAALGLAITGIGAVGGIAMSKIGEGLTDLSVGIEHLDDVGGKVDPKNLENAGSGLKNFFTGITSWGSAGGAAITSLTGDLDKLAVGLGKLNDLEVDEDKLTKVGVGLANFLSGSGSGSLWSSIKGSAVSALAPDMMTLGSGIDVLNKTANDFNLEGWTAMGKGVGEMNAPLAELISTAFSGNFAGSESLSDIASGITSLNATEVDKLSNVAAGLKLLDKDLFEVIKTALASNFAGADSLSDIASGVTTLNNTEVDKLGVVAKGFKVIDKPLYELAKTGIVASRVNASAFSDIASGIKHLQNDLGTDEAFTKSKLAAQSIRAIIPALKELAEADLGGGFLSDNGIDDTIKAFEGMSKTAPGLITSSTALGNIAGGIKDLAKTDIDKSLGVVASELENHVPTINEQIDSLANNQTNFKRAAKNLEKFGKLSDNSSTKLNNQIELANQPVDDANINLFGSKDKGAASVVNSGNTSNSGNSIINNNYGVDSTLSGRVPTEGMITPGY